MAGRTVEYSLFMDNPSNISNATCSVRHFNVSASCKLAKAYQILYIKSNHLQLQLCSKTPVLTCQLNPHPFQISVSVHWASSFYAIFARNTGKHSWCLDEATRYPIDSILHAHQLLHRMQLRLSLRANYMVSSFVVCSPRAQIQWRELTCSPWPKSAQRKPILQRLFFRMLLEEFCLQVTVIGFRCADLAVDWAKEEQEEQETPTQQRWLHQRHQATQH